MNARAIAGTRLAVVFRLVFLFFTHTGKERDRDAKESKRVKERHRLWEEYILCAMHALHSAPAFAATSTTIRVLMISLALRARNYAP